MIYLPAPKKTSAKPRKTWNAPGHWLYTREDHGSREERRKAERRSLREMIEQSRIW